MSVEVVLEGILGKKFGKTWNLHVSSPSEALRLINANNPGLLDWIRQNVEVYSKYRVECEYECGSTETLSEETYEVQRGNVIRITFVPILEGSGGGGGLGQMLIGAALIVASFYVPAAWQAFTMKMGVGILIGGVIQMLTPMPKMNRDADGSGKRQSNYFDGPQNNTTQGNPVPVCYGCILAGSQAVSATLKIKQVA